MLLPEDGPTTLAAVKTQLSLEATDVLDDEVITGIVAAVNARVRSWPVARVASNALDWSDPEVAHVVLGATMLAARLVRRRNSPEGVAAFGDQGPVYVQRNDPDVAMLLQLGAHTKPVAR